MFEQQNKLKDTEYHIDSYLTRLQTFHSSDLRRLLKSRVDGGETEIMYSSTLLQIRASLDVTAVCY